MKPRDLFISHSSGDAEAARELRAILEEAGYSCWMAPDDVEGTETWTEQILGAIDATRAMLVLVSSHANQSQHVSREVNLAQSRRRAVLPIRIEAVAPSSSLEYLLSLTQRVDAFPPPIAAHRDQILRRLAGIIPATVEPGLAVVADTTADAVAAEVAPRDDGRDPDALVLTPPESLAPTSSVPPISAGSQIAGFTVGELIGEGGMASIYRARQAEPNRAVALKVIRADHAADPSYRQRFLAEKDTLAGLEHPSIVPIYAAGEASGVLYIAMRLVDGHDLAERLRTAGHLSLQDTIQTLQPIADAIDYAHEMGVIHRDLKPSNIVLDRQGRPYLTDFGLGKRIDGGASPSAPGIAVGTLEYMAPEQFSGTPDPALAKQIDMYALGCVAYCCLVGTPPFRKDTPAAVMYAHANEAVPSVRALRPDLPPAVDSAVRKAMAKSPAARHGSAREFIQALAAAESQAEGRTAPVVVPGAASPIARAGRMVRNHVAVAGISAVAIVALVVVSSGVLGFGLVSSATSPPGSSPTAMIGSTDSSPSLDIAIATPSSSLPESIPPSTSPDLSTPSLSPDPVKPNPPPVQSDVQPPTSVSIKVVGTTVLTTKVSLTPKATGATQMRFGNASSGTGDCSSWSNWVTYRTSYKYWSLTTGLDGTRWVCAQYRDAAQNESSIVRDHVIFDHAPVAGSSGSLTFDYSVAELSGKTSIKLVFFDSDLGTSIAKDIDGLSTLTVTKLWRVNSGGSTTDVSSALIESGTSARFYITQPYCGSDTTFTYGFTVKDNHNIKDNGGFKLRVCS